MLSDREIREAADSYREKNWHDGKVPIDIELILERMGIDIVPVANFRSEVGVDACLSADLKTIHIDLGYYMDDRMAFRVRFSEAHELGHLILHRRLFEDYRKLGTKTILEWAQHIRDRFENEIYEKEADEFASCLLVPERDLQIQYEKHYPVIYEEFRKRGIDLDSVPGDTLRSYLARPIHRTFEVSRVTIEVRLRKYGICPN